MKLKLNYMAVITKVNVKELLSYKPDRFKSHIILNGG